MAQNQASTFWKFGPLSAYISKLLRTPYVSNLPTTEVMLRRGKQMKLTYRNIEYSFKTIGKSTVATEETAMYLIAVLHI